MPRPPVKKTFRLAKAQAYGEELGKLEANRHFREDMKKGQESSIKEGIFSTLKSMVEKIDPLEALAMGSATVLLHEVLSKSTDFLTEVDEKFSVTVLLNPITGLVANALWQILPEGVPKQNINMKPSELMLWIIAFLVAFILIRYGGEIISSLGGVLGVGKLLLGIV